jgi:hypothetical protein
MITPAGAGPMLFITSTTESLKLGSRSSARATRRIVFKGFALSADVGHEIASTRRNAQRARIMVASELGVACTQDANSIDGVAQPDKWRGNNLGTRAWRKPHTLSGRFKNQ